MAAPKARGVTVDNPKIDEARQKPEAEIVDRADQPAGNVVPIMRQIQRSGQRLRQISGTLKARATARGGTWSAMQVSNVLQRAQTKA